MKYARTAVLFMKCRDANRSFFSKIVLLHMSIAENVKMCVFLPKILFHPLKYCNDFFL